MAERFTIDGLIYEVDFSGDTINFAIVGGANPAYDTYTYDPFDSPDDWDKEPSVTADIGVTRYPLRVYRQVLLRVYDWLGRTRPKTFSFSAWSDRRYWIYERVARHLAERFDYDLQIIGNGFFIFQAEARDSQSGGASCSHPSPCNYLMSFAMPLSAERLSRALFDTDPMGTCCKENDCFDEYDAIANDIVSRCQRGQPLDNALDETFEDWFGAELAERIDTQALCTALTNHTNGPSA